MRLVFKSFLAVTLAVAFAASADAQGQRRGGGGGQPPGGGRGGQFGGGMMGGAQLTQIVTNKGVQEEIKATDEQKEKLGSWAREAGGKMFEQMRELGGGGGERPDPAKVQEVMAKVTAEQMEEVGKVLKEDQVKRVKQIMLQVQGVNAFSTKAVEVALKLTDEQKSTIKEIAEAMRAEQREAFAGGGGGGGRGNFDAAALAEMQKKRAEMTKKYVGKVAAQLKDDQKKSWEDMTGKPFDYKPEMQRRRDN